MSIWAFGPFRFGLRAPAPDTLTRAFPMRWVGVERIARRPAQQFLGPGEEVIAFSGVLYPHHTGGLGQIEGMKRAAQFGLPYMLAAGTGIVYGMFVMKNLADTLTYFDAQGIPRKVEFTVELVAYGEDVWSGIQFF